MRRKATLWRLAPLGVVSLELPVNRILVRRFIGFIAIGGVATVLQYVVLVAAVEKLGTSPVTGSSVGYVLSAVVNYLLNYHFNFRSRSPHMIAASRFAVVSVCGLLLNGAVMALLGHVPGMPYLLAQVAATAVVLGWNFLGNALWSFAHGVRRPRDHKTGGPT